jgi:hypothetical protein
MPTGHFECKKLKKCPNNRSDWPNFTLRATKASAKTTNLFANGPVYRPAQLVLQAFIGL